jgi:rare lipoprotein A
MPLRNTLRYSCIALPIVFLTVSCGLFGQAASIGHKETGLAAVYSSRLNGHTTSSGQTFDQKKLTAAHRTLPFGTKIKVTNPKNHRSVVLRVNDRGPAQRERILDISSAAARRLGIPHNSMRPVELEVVSLGGHVRQ